MADGWMRNRRKARVDAAVDLVSKDEVRGKEGKMEKISPELVLMIVN